jgi:hypothetical protein
MDQHFSEPGARKGSAGHHQPYQAVEPGTVPVQPGQVPDRVPDVVALPLFGHDRLALMMTLDGLGALVLDGHCLRLGLARWMPGKSMTVSATACLPVGCREACEILANFARSALP